jgi:hypothetical protein
VYVNFLTEEEFKQKVTAPTSDQSDEDLKQLQDSVAVFRALGLIQGDVNLLEQSNQLRQGGTLAFYSPRTKQVYVRGTELDVSHKVTLVHELTHALQDQNFDLDKLTAAKTDDERIAFRTIVEGDAVRIERKYIDKLPENERNAYKDQYKKDSTEARKEVSGVPDVLVASFSAPYEFGTPFLDVLEAKGKTTAVNEAFRRPPAGESQIIDPDDYFAKRSFSNPSPPPLPAGAERLGDHEDGTNEYDHLGVLDLYLMLASRIDAHDALKVVDAWNGDAMVVYRSGGSLCTQVRVAVDDKDAADATAPILDQWVDKMPSEAKASVQRNNERFDITACDPGPKADAGIVGKPSEAFSLPEVRLYIYAQALDADLPKGQITCISKAFTDKLTVEEASKDTPGQDEIQRRIVEARDSCK